MQAIDQIMTAEEEVLQTQTGPHGVLRVTAPVELGGASGLIKENLEIAEL